MAKDLPYFKFYSSEWNDGDITIESLCVQGLFINICSYYWSKECVVEFSKLKKKYIIHEKELQILIDSEIIKVNDIFVKINFLDEQLTERENNSKIRSKGGKASAEARRLLKLNNTSSTENEHMLNLSSTETQLLRKEKKREDNSILINNLLSEIKISDDKKYLKINEKDFFVTENDIKYFLIAVQFQKLFIKNLKEKKSPTIKQENATYKEFVTPIRLMFEKNEATKEQLLEAYGFLNSTDGEFWKSNILTTEKLREKLSILIAKKNTKSNFEAKKESLIPDHTKRKGF